METVENVSVRNNILNGGEEHVRWNRLIPVGLLAALVAAIANAVVYLVASAAGAMPQDLVVNGQGPIMLPMVAAMSTLGAVAGACVYALTGRFARRPVRSFRIMAAVALVLSFVGPSTIPGAPMAMVATLLLMHVVTAVVVVALLTTMAAHKA